jgi:hypothetical protein
MEYTYIFPDLTDKLESVQVLHHCTNKEYRIWMKVIDEQLTRSRNLTMPSIAADLIDIATCVYVADWLSPRKQRRSYDIHIDLPVRHPEKFNDAGLADCLKKLLRWYTRDHWHFNFRLRSRPGRYAEHAHKLFEPYSNDSIEVALTHRTALQRVFSAS